mmetsp:Transcript_11661/g.13214  ORF Transcript_11661/g.13214 Transcript_11661/m.13214 type:complete len:286 (-) Transcript_11661:54-911(-)
MSFDLSSSSSSDEISALLTGDYNEDGIGIAALANNSRLSANNSLNNDDDNHNHRQTHHATRTLPTTTIKENEKFFNKKNCADNMTRVIVGESVKAWCRHRKNAHNRSINSTQPKYIMVQQRDAPDPAKFRDCESESIDYKNAHVNVESGDKDKIEIVLPSSVLSSSSTTVLSSSVITKRQLPHNGNQKSTSSPPVSNSVFVDCVAIWNFKRKVYVLEVPELIIKDATMPSSTCTAAGGIKIPYIQNDAHVQNHISKNSALRPYDPIEQQRKAESKLLNRRKRRRS